MLDFFISQCAICVIRLWVSILQRQHSGLEPQQNAHSHPWVRVCFTPAPVRKSYRGLRRGSARPFCSRRAPLASAWPIQTKSPMAAR